MQNKNVNILLFKLKKVSITIFNAIKWIFFDISGLRNVFRKIVPLSDEEKEKSKNVRPPATIIFWLFGLYIGLFGIASQRYENRIDVIENRATTIYAQLGTSALKMSLSRISDIQNMGSPEKPLFFNPIRFYKLSEWKKIGTTFNSLLGRDDLMYPEIVFQLKETIVNWKDSLSSVNLKDALLDSAILPFADLNYANLTSAHLMNTILCEAKLQKAILLEADLREAWLVGAYLDSSILSMANLESANLTGAHLNNADLSDAILRDADLTNASFDGAILDGAKLHSVMGLNFEQLKKVRSMFYVEGLSKELEKKIIDSCNTKYRHENGIDKYRFERDRSKKKYSDPLFKWRVQNSKGK